MRHFCNCLWFKLLLQKSRNNYYNLIAMLGYLLSYSKCFYHFTYTSITDIFNNYLLYQLWSFSKINYNPKFGVAINSRGLTAQSIRQVSKLQRETRFEIGCISRANGNLKRMRKELFNAALYFKLSIGSLCGDNICTRRKFYC